MNRPPAFQLYVKDWLTSRKIAVMDLAQVGAYILLLTACWDSDDCSLPDDEKTLATLSRMGEQWFTDASAPVRTCFTPHPKHLGHLTNKRLLAEFQSLLKFRRAKQRAGHIGGVKSGVTRRNLRVNIVETNLKHTLDSASSKTEANRTSSSSSSILKTKSKSASHHEGLNGHQAGFDIFWSSYPKKRSKGRVERVWAELKPDDVLLGTMLAKLDQAKQTADWMEKRGKYIPHPATWLNAKGWEDDYTTALKERIPL